MQKEQKFWFKWMFKYGVGELIGIGMSAIIARFLFFEFSDSELASSTAVTAIVLVMAGVAEGLIIGYIQWRSLSKFLVGFKRNPWIITTMLAVVAGWILILPPAVMIVFFFAKLTLVNHYHSILYTTIAGLAFGSLVGMAQFFILRKFYGRAIMWIFANALGWTASFLLFYLSLLLFAAPVFNVMIVAGACILSGLIQGIITGSALHFVMVVKKPFERVAYN